MDQETGVKARLDEMRPQMDAELGTDLAEQFAALFDGRRDAEAFRAAAFAYFDRCADLTERERGLGTAARSMLAGWSGCRVFSSPCLWSSACGCCLSRSSG